MLSRAPFGSLRDGRVAEQLTLAVPGGFAVRLTNYGGTLLAIDAPDAGGTVDNVIIGLPGLADYERTDAFVGSLIGRYANRIAGAAFALDGIRHRLAANERGSLLHGGAGGFHRVLWDIVSATDGEAPSVTLRHVSAAGDQGFPGRLDVSVILAVEPPSSLRIAYEATTDGATVVNLTSHPYFNLGGGTALTHRLAIAADAFLPVDDALIPTGEIRSVAGTAFDFRERRAIGDRIADGDEQIARVGGYDHTFVLRQRPPSMPAAVLEGGRARRLELFTDQPGLQLYTGNALDGQLSGPDGRAWRRHDAVCLEPQHFPDSPNRPEFPSTVLRPGETWRSATTYRFSVAR